MPQSDATAVVFSQYVAVRILFKSSIYYFGKSTDINKLGCYPLYGATCDTAMSGSTES